MKEDLPTYVLRQIAPELKPEDRKMAAFILSNLDVEQLQELPDRYNYPLNLYVEDTTAGRPESLEECVTIRHEGFYEDPLWTEKMPARSPLKKWIAERLL